MKYSRRELLLAGSIASLFPRSSNALLRDNNYPQTEFEHLKIGGGGEACTINISPDSTTKLVNTDEAGAYIWNNSTSNWNQVITQASMPATNFGFYPHAAGTGSNDQNSQKGFGKGLVFEIVSAPSSPTTVYMGYGGYLFKSTDRTATWQLLTDFAQMSGGGTNYPYRQNGGKIAVDPNNPDIVYVGTPTEGLRYTKNGGASWNTVSSSQIPNANGYYTLAFDPNNSQKIYVFSCGGGTHMYASTDGGTTWNPTTGGPTGAVGMIVAPTSGIVWVAGTDGKVWKYATGSWATVLSDGGGNYGGYCTIAIDPAYGDNSRMVAITKFGKTNQSINGGSSWAGLANFSRSASDVPWLAWTNELYMLIGNAVYDPSQPHTIVVTDGIGVWAAPGPTTSASNATVAWRSMTAGIENLVVMQVKSPVGGVCVSAQWDRSTFKLNPSNNVYPSTGNWLSASQALVNCYSIDHASTDPKFMVAVMGPTSGSGLLYDYSGYSTDDMSTFKPFNKWIATVPSTALSSGTGGVVRIDLISVSGSSGLTGWSAGTGDILSVMSSDGTGLAGAGTTKVVHYPVHVVDSNTIELQYSSFSSSYTSPAMTGSYTLWVSTNPLSNKNGLAVVTATSSGTRGRIRIAAKLINSFGVPGTIVNLSGVQGTTEANGTWVISASNGLTYFELLGSTYSNTWTSGGVVSSTVPTGGCIACSTPNHIIRMPSLFDFPYYTNDGGKNWTQVPLPAATTTLVTNADASTGDKTLYFNSVPPWVIDQVGMQIQSAYVSGLNAQIASHTATSISFGAPLTANLSAGSVIKIFPGWCFAPYANQQYVAADRAVVDVFYLYNQFQGLYQMVNGVVPSRKINIDNPPWLYGTWPFYANYNVAIKAVPGQSGHIFFSGMSGVASKGLWRSCDGGRHMHRVPGFFALEAFGFGASKAGNTYPSIYVAGWYSPTNTLEKATWGIWRSDDDRNAGVGGYNDTSNPRVSTANTWTLVSNYPNQQWFEINDITGDPATWGRVYVATYSSVLIGTAS